MSVRVLLFAELKDIIGSHSIELDVEKGMSVEQILCQALGDHPQKKIWQDHVLYAVNEEQVAKDHIAQDGDVVALMPPMTGG